MTAITPCLWFDDQAEPAAKFYTDIFKHSKILSVSRFPEAGQEIHGKPAGSAMTVEFELDGQKFTALNGGPQFKFSEAISLQVDCRSQEEVDYFWQKLGAGGQDSQCGWLKDKYGLSWQVVPRQLSELLQDKDPAKSARVMQAMLKMSKIDIATLQKAHAGK
jgi:predicted 3-demethylubiquinone-9 3-methyltransferase (glyoxalase superfamily)